jgi:glycosyltransferase involved in cell wall biosynthesis
MAPRVLHILSQRPGLTGSGVTLDALVAKAAEAGWEQSIAVGVPSHEARVSVGGLDLDSINPLRFGVDGDLPFPVPGMSDVMPYASTRFCDMNASQISDYRTAWKRHIAGMVADFRPDVIHAHHIWIVGSVLKDVAPEVPVVSHCHATGLRQMNLCPHLAQDIRRGCARNEHFAVLHPGHADALEEALGVDRRRISVVGAGYREDLFHRCHTTPDERAGREDRLLYIGKYSAAKGLPWLLDAFDRLSRERPRIELHVAGSGSGSEADELRARMEHMAPSVVLHGQIGQAELASLMRRCSTCILPSFYEGVPLVLVEARACGCRLVATDLPGVVSEIAPAVGEAIEVVPRPRLVTVDVPRDEDLPPFVDRLTASIERSLDKPPIDSPSTDRPPVLDAFTWGSVFRRVETIWRDLGGPTETASGTGAIRCRCP